STPFAGSGLFLVEVAHEGNQASAPEEVDVVDRVVRSLLDVQWVGRDGDTRALVANDVLVLAPYNVQVGALRRRLRDAGVQRVGGVNNRGGEPTGGAGNLRDRGKRTPMATAGEPAGLPAAQASLPSRLNDSEPMQLTGLASP